MDKSTNLIQLKKDVFHTKTTQISTQDDENKRIQEAEYMKDGGRILY